MEVYLNLCAQPMKVGWSGLWAKHPSQSHFLEIGNKNSQISKNWLFSKHSVLKNSLQLSKSLFLKIWANSTLNLHQWPWKLCMQTQTNVLPWCSSWAQVPTLPTNWTNLRKKKNSSNRWLLFHLVKAKITTHPRLLKKPRKKVNGSCYKIVTWWNLGCLVWSKWYLISKKLKIFILISDSFWLPCQLIISLCLHYRILLKWRLSLLEVYVLTWSVRLLSFLRNNLMKSKNLTFGASWCSVLVSSMLLCKKDVNLALLGGILLTNSTIQILKLL